MSLLSDHIPAEPPASADSNGASFKRQTLTRRPTTIRVPSKTGSRESSELTHDCWKMSFLSKYTQVMSHLPMPGWIMGTRFQHVMLTTSSLFSLRFFSGRSSTSPRSEARGLPPRLGGPQTGLHARPPVPGEICHKLIHVTDTNSELVSSGGHSNTLESH